MWDYEKLSVKIDLGQIKEFHEKKLNFETSSRKWTHKFIDWNWPEFLMLIKGILLKKCTVAIQILPNDNTFSGNCLSYFSFKTSSFCFHSYFRKHLNLILIITTIVEKMVELYKFSFINSFNKLLLFHHF